MPDPHPRYVVLEQKMDGLLHFGGYQPGPTVFCILDSWYGFREVWYGRSSGKVWQRHLPKLRRTAQRLAAEWNAEHDAWLAA